MFKALPLSQNQPAETWNIPAVYSAAEKLMGFLLSHFPEFPQPKIAGEKQEWQVNRLLAFCNCSFITNEVSIFFSLFVWSKRQGIHSTNNCGKPRNSVDFREMRYNCAFVTENQNPNNYDWFTSLTHGQTEQRIKTQCERWHFVLWWMWSHV